MIRREKTGFASIVHTAHLKPVRFVLNFLRGSCVLPTDPLALRELELELEADFYALDGLCDAVRVLLAKPPSSVHAGLCAIAERL